MYNLTEKSFLSGVIAVANDNNFRRLIAEANGSTGAMTREYVYLNGKPLAEMDASGNVYLVYNDQTGRPQKITDSTPAIVWDSIIKPYGDSYSITGTYVNNIAF